MDTTLKPYQGMRLKILSQPYLLSFQNFESCFRDSLRLFLPLLKSFFLQ